jgi:hypothetical protein
VVGAGGGPGTELNSCRRESGKAKFKTRPNSPMSGTDLEESWTPGSTRGTQVGVSREFQNASGIHASRRVGRMQSMAAVTHRPHSLSSDLIMIISWLSSRNFKSGKPLPLQSIASGLMRIASTTLANAA